MVVVQRSGAQKLAIVHLVPNDQKYSGVSLKVSLAKFSLSNKQRYFSVGLGVAPLTPTLEIKKYVEKGDFMPTLYPIWKPKLANH